MNKNLNESYTFGREQATLAILLITFECCYLIRYLYDELISRNIESLSYFQYYLYADLVYILDGICFLSFMLLHKSNFQEQKLQSIPDNASEDQTSEYVAFRLDSDEHSDQMQNNFSDDQSLSHPRNTLLNDQIFEDNMDSQH